MILGALRESLCKYTSYRNPYCKINYQKDYKVNLRKVILRVLIVQLYHKISGPEW